MTIIGTDVALYTVNTIKDGPRGTTTVARLDPVSGRTEATRTLGDGADESAPGQGQPVLADGLLWVASAPDPSGLVRLYGLDAALLRVVRAVPLTFAGIAAQNQTAALAAAPDGNLLYVGAGNSYLSLDPRSGRVRARTPVTGGQVGALAVAPDGSRVFVGINDPAFYFGAADAGQVQSRRADSGALTAEIGGPTGLENEPYLGGIQSLLATSGGLWVSDQPGPHGEAVTFFPANLDFDRAVFPAGRTGGGGVLAIATSGATAVWIAGGNTAVSCADPLTGAMRATTVPADMITAVTFAANSAFAIAVQTHALLRLQPPSVCMR